MTDQSWQETLAEGRRLLDRMDATYAALGKGNLAGTDDPIRAYEEAHSRWYLWIRTHEVALVAAAEEAETLRTRLAAVHTYVVNPEQPDYLLRVRIERRDDQWVILWGAADLLKQDGLWESELIHGRPSPEFIARTRYTLDEAWQRAVQAATEIEEWYAAGRPIERGPKWSCG